MASEIEELFCKNMFSWDIRKEFLKDEALAAKHEALKHEKGKAIDLEAGGSRMEGDLLDVILFLSMKLHNLEAKMSEYIGNESERSMMTNTSGNDEDENVKRHDVPVHYGGDDRRRTIHASQPMAGSEEGGSEEGGSEEGGSEEDFVKKCRNFTWRKATAVVWAYPGAPEMNFQITSGDGMLGILINSLKHANRLAFVDDHQLHAPNMVNWQQLLFTKSHAGEALQSKDDLKEFYSWILAEMREICLINGATELVFFSRVAKAALLGKDDGNSKYWFRDESGNVHSWLLIQRRQKPPYAYKFRQMFFIEDPQVDSKGDWGLLMTALNLDEATATEGEHSGTRIAALGGGKVAGQKRKTSGGSEGESRAVSDTGEVSQGVEGNQKFCKHSSGGAGDGSDCLTEESLPEDQLSAVPGSPPSSTSESEGPTQWPVDIKEAGQQKAEEMDEFAKTNQEEATTLGQKYQESEEEILNAEEGREHSSKGANEEGLLSDPVAKEQGGRPGKAKWADEPDWPPLEDEIYRELDEKISVALNVLRKDLEGRAVGGTEQASGKVRRESDNASLAHDGQLQKIKLELNAQEGREHSSKGANEEGLLSDPVAKEQGGRPGKAKWADEPDWPPLEDEWQEISSSRTPLSSGELESSKGTTISHVSSEGDSALLSTPGRHGGSGGEDFGSCSLILHGGGPVRDLLFGPSGTLYSADRGGTVIGWNTKTGAVKSKLRTSKSLFSGGDIRTLALGFEGTVWAGDSKGKIHEWRQEKHVKTLTGHKMSKAVSALVVAPSGMLWSGSRDGQIKGWERGKCVITLFPPRMERVSCLAFMSKSLVSSSDEGSIFFWEGNRPVMELPNAHDGPIFALAKGLDEMLWSAGADRVIRGWRDGVLVKEWRGQASNDHTDAILTLAVSPDGTVWSGSRDGKVKGWQMGKCVATLDGCGGTVHSLTVDPDGLHIWSGSEDQNVRRWTIENLSGAPAGQELRTVTTGKPWTEAVAEDEISSPLSFLSDFSKLRMDDSKDVKQTDAEATEVLGKSPEQYL